MRNLPTGSCDCHVHIFGPQSDFPFDNARVYTPGEASLDQLLALHRRIGMSRVVLVQPSVYGTDNACLLDALTALGPRARAVAVIDAATSGAELARLHAAGVRGVRINIATAGMNDPAAALVLLEQTARQVAPLGWHVQVLTKPVVIATLGPKLAGLATPLVVDHFGLPDLTAGPEQPDFAALVALVRTGRMLVKLSAMERLTGAGEGHRLAPYIRALVAANPQALLWGSDWPHTGGGRNIGRAATDIEPFEPLDDALALSALTDAVDTATLVRILVANPARLYDFPAR